MVFVYFSARCPKGTYQECSLGGADIEFCLDMLSSLVREGWQLDNIKLSDYPGSTTWLPAEAFDGEPIEKPLQWLQREWKEILQQN